MEAASKAPSTVLGKASGIVFAETSFLKSHFQQFLRERPDLLRSKAEMLSAREMVIDKPIPFGTKASNENFNAMLSGLARWQLTLKVFYLDDLSQGLCKAVKSQIETVVASAKFDSDAEQADATDVQSVLDVACRTWPMNDATPSWNRARVCEGLCYAAVNC